MTLGPRILLQCPLSEGAAREWFVQLWNDKLIPYMAKVLSESERLSLPLKGPNLKIHRQSFSDVDGRQRRFGQ